MYFQNYVQNFRILTGVAIISGLIVGTTVLDKMIFTLLGSAIVDSRGYLFEFHSGGLSLRDQRATFTT